MNAFRFEGEDAEIPSGYASGAFTIEVRRRRTDRCHVVLFS